MSGTFGIFGHPDAAAITALGLHALQHRGQEAAGIVSFDGNSFHIERRSGLVGDSFSRPEVIERLSGNTAIGHVLSSATDRGIDRNVQPLVSWFNDAGIALAHAGNLTNGLTLRRKLIEDGTRLKSTADAEVIVELLQRSDRRQFVERLIETLRVLDGSYALVGFANNKLFGARDPLGIRPLILGNLDGCPILASESCALSIIGARYVRQVENGEIVVFDKNGAQTSKPFSPMQPRPCALEYIHVSRPDSRIDDRTFYSIRKACGMELAREALAAADVVVPIPDSGVPAAIGYAQESRIPYDLGIVRNHYFMGAAQHVRPVGARLKHSANCAVVDGKRVVLVDDWLIRGTTAMNVVRITRDAGAREVHLRIASPPITHPDYYGVHIPERDKLLAVTHDLAGARQFIGADSLAFLSVDGLYRAIGKKHRDMSNPQLADHCFTGEYPTPLTDLSGTDYQNPLL